MLCAVDWCVLCNGSYDSFRASVASAAGTIPARSRCKPSTSTPARVGLDAQRLLAEAGVPHLHLGPEAVIEIEQRLAAAVRQSLGKLQPFDRIGIGQAKVDCVAATRRPVDASGKIAVRYSSCTDPAITSLPEGKIDPYLKTITFAHGEKPLGALHYYATHPQSRYGDDRATSDFRASHVRNCNERKAFSRSISRVAAATLPWASTTTAPTSPGKSWWSDAGRHGGLDRRDQAGSRDSDPLAGVPTVLPRRTGAGFTLADCLA